MQIVSLDSFIGPGVKERSETLDWSSLDMTIMKSTVLGGVLASFFAISAYAADPTPANPTAPPQIATNPGLPYSTARMPGPKVGPSTWIPSPHDSAPSSSAPASGTDDETGGSYYSGKGFGPKPQ
jgi:hypothetical protein